jgi:hypothetical protein
MDKVNLPKLVKSVRATVLKHQPEILTGIGITGMITTTVMAVKATPKALDLMADVKEKHAESSDKKAFCKDVLLKVAPVYIPAALIGGLSVSCLIGASSVNYKRNAALATAYTLSESALKEYQDKVVETIGEKKEEAVRAAIAKDRIDKNPAVDREVIITGNGDTRCYDPLSSRYFDSDIETIRKSVNELNRHLLLDDYVSLNDFYCELGLDTTEIGDTIGWRSDKGLVELSFYPIMDKKERPCLALEYHVAPYHDYDK